MAESQSIRFDRIEGKIDKVYESQNEGFLKIARMEERIISLFKSNEEVFSQIKAMEEAFNHRVDQLEEIVKEQAKTINDQNHQIRDNSIITTRITKLFWAAVTAIPTGWIGLLFYILRERT